MTDNDVYQFIKKKVQEGIEKDAAIERKKQEELAEIARTYKFLEEFKEKHSAEMKKYRLIQDDWLMYAADPLWRLEEYWNMRQVWAERDCQYQWCLNFRGGKHTTGPLTFNQIADALEITVGEVKKFISSLEKDDLIGKMKFNGFFPYWWYIKQ